MQVQVRRPRKPGLDEEAYAAWNSHTTAEPSVRNDVSTEDLARIIDAIDAAAAAQSQRADAESAVLRRQGGTGNSAAVDMHTENASRLRELSERFLQSYRVILEERPSRRARP